MTRTAAAAFTEADLAWIGPNFSSSCPPTHLDLTRVQPTGDDEELDIVAALEAIATPCKRPGHSASPASSSLADLSFVPSPPPPGPLEHDLMAAHLLRPPTPRNCSPPEFSAADLSQSRVLSKEEVRLVSPTDIALRTSHAGTFSHSSTRQLQETFAQVPLPLVIDASIGDQSSVQNCSFDSQNTTPPAFTSAGAAVLPVVLDVSLHSSLHQESSFSSRSSPPLKSINKPRRSRSSGNPVPSRFCHICARTQKSRKMFCANLNTERKCRKSVCEPCFIELRWDFGASSQWLCPHCRGICHTVPRARCHIYNKTNEKRKAAKRLL